jgi:hypothetical protein
VRISVLLIASLVISSVSVAKDISGENLADFYLVKKPSQRMKDQASYFAHEYQQINARREGKDSDVRPKFLTGLALSGGGIRSSAYQLGLLSGLYGSDNLLGGIDYISSVSGGSWANGSYWAWAHGDRAFFGCLDTAATNDGAECEAAIMLNSEQPFAELPVDGVKLKARKRQWKEYIESVYLPYCNVNAEVIEAAEIDGLCAQNYRTKPYIIINASHSVPINDQEASERNMPFQFTLDNMGTLSDCQPTRKGCDQDERKYGFFVNNLSEDFAWVNKALFRKDTPQNSLSSAMATSSAVVAAPVLLSYEYELFKDPRISMLGNWRGNKIKEIREEFVLSDGGKSENLGLVPLVERGVDLIAISYMGKDSDLSKNPWEDLDVAVKQVKNLLNCDVSIPDRQADLNKFIHETEYVCNGQKGSILHVKASYQNATPFIDQLESAGQAKLAKYLRETDVNNNAEPKDRFPQTRTMMQQYDHQLIKAYYLFGRWIAKEHLSKTIRQHQSRAN